MSTQLEIVAEAYQLIKPSEAYFFPESKLRNDGFLEVSHLHRIYFSEYGRPDGVPVVVVHGGPGGRTTPNDARYFDSNIFRIILVDQRGTGRSQPYGEVRENNTSNLIEDMEKLRNHLKIDKWLLLGGSWGSALSLAYGQAHPDRVLGFILRGVFLGTKEEYLKLWNGMGDTYPETFAAYRDFIPKDEQHDLLGAYYKRLVHPDPTVHMPAARAFCHYDFTCASLIDKSFVKDLVDDDGRSLSLARFFAHYCMNEFFFTHDQLMKNLAAISHLPVIIVHGRYDVICRVSSAYRLHQHWPNSKLVIVQDAGHSTNDPGIVNALVKAGIEMKARIS